MWEDAVGMGKQVQADLTLELAPRRLSSCHFNDGAAYTPDVCLPAMARLLDDLWSHPVGRPLHALVPRVCRVQHQSGNQQHQSGNQQHQSGNQQLQSGVPVMLLFPESAGCNTSQAFRFKVQFVLHAANPSCCCCPSLQGATSARHSKARCSLLGMLLVDMLARTKHYEQGAPCQACCWSSCG